MKYVDEYRDPNLVLILAERLRSLVTRPWRVMEICGGQTHSILKWRLQDILPPDLTLIHGPGCPVCVTSEEIIDRAIFLSQQKGITVFSYGDMLRVPGRRQSLLQSQARGGSVKLAYSPLEALAFARANPHEQVVFLAIGFETTAPAHALTILKAQAEGITNFSLLTSHVLVPPALRHLKTQSHCQIDGFIAAGHVCTIMGEGEYQNLTHELKTPIVITGFEPVDILQGLVRLCEFLQQQRVALDNQYSRSVKADGNIPAQRALFRVFEICDQEWRGFGVVPRSGLSLKAEFANFNTTHRWSFPSLVVDSPKKCVASEILQGHKKPWDCPEFAKGCHPLSPLGAPMVSSEGVCAAYYNYQRKSRVEVCPACEI